MKRATKHNPTRRRAQHGDLALQRNRAQAAKGGIIIVNSMPQLRAATLNPLTTRGLNPQPLPPRQ